MQPADKIGYWAVLLVSAIGLSITFTAGESLSDPVIHPIQWLQSSGDNQRFSKALEQNFGSYEAPKLLDESISGKLARKLWMQKCSQCHGADGRAATPTASLLSPRPRDFTLGIVKYVTSPAGDGHPHRPSKSDIRKVIQQGAPFTSMSAFDELSATELDALTAYTLWLLARNATAQLSLKRLGASFTQTIAAAKADVQNQFDSANQPFIDMVSKGRSGNAEVGRSLFQNSRAACHTCHGIDGSGNGPAAATDTGQPLLKDAWGRPSLPRDLRLGQLHGGASTRDVFSRIKHGIPGTPMPPSNNLSDSEILDLTAFVLSLGGLQ